MSKTESTAQTATPTEPSISEIEFATRLGWGVRTMLNYRKAGKLPTHFLAPTGRSQKQIRYLLRDVEAYEASLKSKA